MSDEVEIDPDANDHLTYTVGGNPQEILLDISKEAHEYVKLKTEHLTSLLLRPESQPDPGDETDEQVSIRDGTKDRPMDFRRLVYRQRLHSSPLHENSGVSAYAKDYARIVHSPSFRRLQGKTQLIPAGENEFFRTRLTHSFEVAEIATRIARKLNSEYDYFRRHPINIELVSCAALLHDIGHPPFGHSGEEVLNEKMKDHGGFEGNAQTLRIITQLENRLERGQSVEEIAHNPCGLNLTVGTLASVIKYDRMSTGPTVDADNRLKVSKGYYPTEERTVKTLRDRLALSETARLYTLECQIMDIADDIAYSAYDLEDTLEAGIVTPFDLMSINDKTLEMIERDMREQFAKRNALVSFSSSEILSHLHNVFGVLLVYADGEDTYEVDRFQRHRHVFVARTYLESLQYAKNPLIRRQYLETMIERNIESLSLEFNDACPCLSLLRVEPSRLIAIEAVKAFNFHKVINSRRLQVNHHRNKKIIAGIFDALQNDGGGKLLSEFQRQQLQACDGDHLRRMRLIADIISTLTDNEAVALYDQLYSSRKSALSFVAYS